MIEKVSVVNLNKRQNTPSTSTDKQTSFSGLGDGFIQAIQWCEKYPMLNVSVLDLSTAIIPRTAVETKEANAYAGFEAFRRESSGLIVNCLLPGFIVLGLSRILQGTIMGDFKNSKGIYGSWANSDSLDKIQKYYTEAKGEGRDKVKNMFTNMFNDLEGVDGDVSKDGLKDFSKLYSKHSEDFDKHLNTLVDEIMKDKPNNKVVKKAIADIINTTHISENIRFKVDKEFFTTSFDSLYKSAVKMTNGIRKEGLTTIPDVAKYISRAKKLVKVKSLAGLGIVIPLAISMQPLNRWITSKHSGKKGAPIYKDYIESEHKELTSDEKSKLLKQKFVSIGSMIGVAILSMMKLPSMKVLEFKGLFPSMDQARIISTATFASRMATSEDRNELRESTIRDIATFSGLYFLGDYAAKAIATGIEKFNKDIHLVNKLKPVKPDAGTLSKFWHWVKNTSLKSSDELRSAKERRLRTVCQLGNLAFSLLALGIFIPELYKAQTNRKRQQELEKQAQVDNKSNKHNNTSTKVMSDKYIYDIMDADMSTPFKSFFSSQRIK